MFERLKKTTKALVYGRDNISPNVDKFMKDHGDEPILELIISRNIVSSLLTGSMKLISSQFRERAKSDKLYHLKLLIKINTFFVFYFKSHPMSTICKRIPKSHLAYNTKEIQDFKAKTCGFFAIAFIIFLHINSSDNLYKKSSSFSDLFLLDTKLNNKKLQKFFRFLPKQSTLPILKKLYSQK